MSRIGNKLIKIPKNVTVKILSNNVVVEGPRGVLNREFHHLVCINQKDDELFVKRKDDSKQAKSLHGLSRTLLANMLIGVTNGFIRELSISGVGYKAESKGREIHLTLGFSHPVVHLLPEHVAAFTDPTKTQIRLESINKEILGETAAKIRSYRPPEPYRGKGIRYSNEIIKRKEGKSAGK